MAELAYNRDKFKEILGNSKEVSDFVDTFTSEDILILQLYYKWVTKQVAKNAGISGLLADEAIRKRMLAEYGADDWQFAGVIDHGYKGAVHCSHKGAGGSKGHSLRYAYYAYSPALNQEIVFGQDCMGNFLGVDVKILTKLTQILYDTDKEVRNALAYGRNSVKLKNSTCYTMLHSLRNNAKMNHLFVSILGKTATELFLNFIHSGFVLPQRLDELVRNAYQETVRELIWFNPKLELFGIDFSDIKHNYPVKTVDSLASNSLKLAPETITIDMKLEDFNLVGLRQVVNCLSLNSYTAGVQFMGSVEGYIDYFKFIRDLNKMYELNKEALENRYPKVPRSVYLKNYFLTVEEAEPAEILAYCYVNDETSLLMTLFNITAPLNILGVLYKNKADLLKLMGGECV